jgi:hypothetical protein
MSKNSLVLYSANQNTELKINMLLSFTEHKTIQVKPLQLTEENFYKYFNFSTDLENPTKN